MAKKYNNTRNFNSADSVLYNGALYPSTTVLMDNGQGVVKDSKIFVDNNGQYYTLGDNGMAYPVMLQHDLPEVEVKPSQEEMLSKSLKNSLTLSQDKARVSNPLNPYESFNNHLRERALRGASEHALWDKEHPNLAAWRDFATAIPFGVASIPLAGGLGETALGQAAVNGVGRVMSNPIVEAGNSALGLGMAVEGAKDLKQGKFTPMTLLDLSGAIMPAKGIVNVIDNAATRSASKLSTARRLSLTDNIPIQEIEEVPLSTDINELRSRINDLTSRVRSVTEDHPELVPTGVRQPWEPSALPNIEVNPRLNEVTSSTTSRVLSPLREEESLPEAMNALPPAPQYPGNTPTSELPQGALYNPMETMSDAAVQRAYTRIIRNVEEDKIRARNDEEFFGNYDSPLDFVTPRPNRLAEYMEQRRAMREAIDSALTSSDDVNISFDPYEDMDLFGRDVVARARHERLSNNLEKSSPNIIVARDVKGGETAYTPEEIDALIQDDGSLKEGIIFHTNSRVKTGGHGDFLSWDDTPTTILKKHLNEIDPNNPKNAFKEMRKIQAANPTGRSGIIIETHPGDTSMDSTPLAYKMATRLGTRFRPLSGSIWGDRVESNSLGYNMAFKQGYGTEADRARALFKVNPDYEATLLKDADGNMTAYELTDENGTFQIPLNTRQEVLDMMNKQLHNFNKHYGTSYSDIVPQPNSIGEVGAWRFGETFDLPNIYGISYKKGGKLCRRKGLTF